MSFGSAVLSETVRQWVKPGSEVLNLWDLTPSGVVCQITCISDIHIAIHSSSIITVMTLQPNNFMAGGHHDPDCVKGSQHEKNPCLGSLCKRASEALRELGRCTLCHSNYGCDVSRSCKTLLL